MKGMMLLSTNTMRVLDEHPLDHSPELDEIQKLLGGPLEAIPGFVWISHRTQRHRCVAFCNENGKMLGFPRNYYATMLWKLSLLRMHPDKELVDHLVGPVVIIYGDDELMASL